MFRRGRYGPGLLAVVSRFISRVAEGRNVTLQGVRPSRTRNVGRGGIAPVSLVMLIVIFLIIRALAGAIGGPRFGRRRRGWGGYGGWHSGVGPFGGGFGGGGGGFGGGFGGFGGGRSGGGGGGASW